MPQIDFIPFPGGGGGSSPWDRILTTVQLHVPTDNVLVQSGKISSPGAGVNSEQYGLTATAPGANSTALGYGAMSIGNSSIAIGSGANTSAGGVNGVAVGNASGVTASNTVAVGVSSTATASDSTALGHSASVSGVSSVSIGSGANNTGDDSIVIGAGSFSFFAQTILLGPLGSTTAANQFVAGTNATTISNVYFGNGVANASPVAYTIHGTGGTGIGIAGANLLLAGGVSGDNATAGGSVKIRTARTGTGTALTDAVIVNGADGSISCPDPFSANSERFGANASAPGLSSTVVGNSSTASANFTTVVGGSASAFGNFSTVVGYTARDNGFTGSIAIGCGSEAKNNHQFVAGFRPNNAQINDVFFGGGVTAVDSSDYTIHGTGSIVPGTPGFKLTLAGGRANIPADAGGDVRIQVATAGSGTTLVDTVFVSGTNGNVGIKAAPGAFDLDVTGSCRITGKLTVLGAIDPPSVSLSGGTALFIDSTDGSTAPLAAAGHGRLRYNNSTQQWETSANGSSYTALNLGPWSRVATVVQLTTPTDSVSVQSGKINSPGTGSQSEQYGFNASTGLSAESLAVGYGAVITGGNNSLAIGHNALAADIGVVVGHEAQTAAQGVTIVGEFGRVGASNEVVALGQRVLVDDNADNSVVIGDHAHAGSSCNASVVVGSSASSNSGAGSVVIGNGGNSNSAINVAIGQFVTANGFASTAIGFEANSVFNFSMALGLRGTTTADNQISAGHIGAEFTNAYFGGGTLYAGAPFVSYRTTPPTPDFMLHGTDGLNYTALGAPTLAASLSSAPAGSSLSGGTYNFKYSYVNKDGFGESPLSPVATISISNGDSITVTPNPTITEGNASGQYQFINIYLDNPVGSGGNYQQISTTFGGPIIITSFSYGNSNDNVDTTSYAGNGYKLQFAGGMGDVSGAGGNIEFYTSQAPNALALAGYFNANDGSLSVPGSGGISDQSERFGLNSQASFGSVAVGYQAFANQGESVAIGFQAVTSPTEGGGDVVIGAQANDNGNAQNVIIGAFSDVTQSSSNVIGFNSHAHGGIVIGAFSNDLGGGIVIGQQSSGTDANAVTIGNNLTNSGVGTVLISSLVTTSNVNAVGIGNVCQPAGDNSVCVGATSTAAFQAVAVGFGAQSGFQASTAIGFNAQATLGGGLALGANSVATGYSFGNVAVGYGAQSTATGGASVAIGYNTTASVDGEVSILNGNFLFKVGTANGVQWGEDNTGLMGWWGATPIGQPTVTGSRGGNAALASLLTQLASLGLIVDNTTA